MYVLWAGYISRIYPESTQELNQILGPFWFVYTAESTQDLKKSVNKPEYTQKLPRNSIKFWALSSLFRPWLHLKATQATPLIDCLACPCSEFLPV